MRLSVRRAEAVKAELVRLGVPAGVITTIGRGEEDLLVPTKDGVREPQNRRVSIEFPVPVPPKPAPAPAPVVAAPPPPPPPPLKWAVTLGPWYGYNLKEVDGGGNDKSSSLVGADLRHLLLCPTPWLPSRCRSRASIRSTPARLMAGADVDARHRLRGAHRHGEALYRHLRRWCVWQGRTGRLPGRPRTRREVRLSPHSVRLRKAAYDYQFRNDWDEGILNGGIGAGYRF